MVNRLRVKRLHDDAKFPYRATDGSAGFDIHALEDVLIEAGSHKPVKTGIALEIPEGYAGFIQPRSGLAAKYGITVVNSPGLIDSDYRGEIKILLKAPIGLDYQISKGDKIAQLVIQKIETPTVVEVKELSETDRGSDGFGSTGV